MPRYFNAIDVDQITLGAGSGAALTTGYDNIFVGANAGRRVTTGYENVILGNYSASGTGEAVMNNAVILSNGNGERCYAYNATTYTNFHGIKTKKDPVQDPGLGGMVGVVINTDNNCIDFVLNNGAGAITTSTATQKSVNAIDFTANNVKNVGKYSKDTLITKLDDTKLQSTSVTGGLSFVKSTPFTLKALQSAYKGITFSAPATNTNELQLDCLFDSATGPDSFAVKPANRTRQPIP